MLEVFVEQEVDGEVCRERVASAPQLAHGNWLQEGGQRLSVDPSVDPYAPSFSVRLGGEPLVTRGLVKGEEQLEIKLDPSGVGRVDLDQGVSVLVKTQTLAHPVVEEDRVVGYRPDPSVLPGF